MSKHSFKDGIKSLVNQMMNSRVGTASNSFVSERIDNTELKAISKLGIARKITDIKSQNIFKEGVSCDNKEQLKILEENIIPEVSKAIKHMLDFGRGVVILFDGEEDTSKPLTTKNINRIRFKAFSGYSVTTQVTNTYDITKDNYNKPTYYNILNKRVHYTRVMDFTYAEPVEEDKPDYYYGGISEFELIYAQLINDSIIERAVPTLIEKVSTFFYKVAGFKQLLQQKKEASLLQYFSNLENLRSIYGAGVLDKEDDTVMQNQSLAGVDSIDKISLRRLAFVTGIPVSWLVGESVQGLNSSGDNETSIFWSMIKNLTTRYVTPVLNEKLVFLGMQKVIINDPYQQSPLEKAKYENQVLNNALIVEQLGFDTEKYMEDKNLSIEIKSEFGEFFPSEEESKE